MIAVEAKKKKREKKIEIGSISISSDELHPQGQNIKACYVEESASNCLLKISWKKILFLGFRIYIHTYLYIYI